MVTLRENIKSIKIDVSNDTSVGLFLITYKSYLPEKQVLVFSLRRYIKHSRKCLNTFPNNSKFVKNTPLGVVFSTLFLVLKMRSNTVFCV